MKTFIAFSAFIAVCFAYPQAEPAGCEFCRKGTGVIFEKARSKDGINYDAHLLVETVCPNLKDPKGCETGVEKWWPKIAPILFSDEAVKEVCNGISDGACEAFRDSNWNCETCIKDIGSIAKVMASDEGLKKIVSVLQGKDFCQNSDLGLSPDQTQACQDYIKDFMPPAVDSLMGVLVITSPRICHDWFDGICKQ